MDYLSAHATLAKRATRNRQAKPTHVELSKYANGSIEPLVRVNYSSNWKKKKVELEWDCRHTALLVQSKMRETAISEATIDKMEIEVIMDLKSPILTKTELPKLCEDPIPSALTDHNLDTLDLISDLEFDAEIDAESVMSPTPSGESKPVIIVDEGYYSDTSPPKSPVLDAFKDDVKTPYFTTRVGISPARAYATRPLSVYPWNIKDTDENDAAVSIAETESTSWLEALSNPLIGAAVAAGVLTGMWLSR